MATEELWRDRAQWEELAQSHGLSIVAADKRCLHVALHSGMRTFALNRDALTHRAVPADVFERAAARLRRGHAKFAA
jgi:hypothetical protein